MNAEVQIEVGQQVRFNGFTQGGEPPENGELLEVGQFYEVAGIDEDGEEPIYQLEVENPKFNAKRKESESNPKSYMIDAYADEIELADDEEESEEGEVAEALGEEVAFADIEAGMSIAVVDASGEIVAEGEVEKKLKASIKIGDETIKNSKNTTFHQLVAEEEGEEEQGEGASMEDYNVEVGYSDVEVGGVYKVSTKEAEMVGEVTKVTRASLTLEDEEGAETFKKAEIVGIFALEGEEQEEEQEEEEEKAPAKAKGKGQTPAKGKGQTPAKGTGKGKGKGKDKEEEEEEEADGLVDLSAEEEDEEVVALVEESEDLAQLVRELAEEVAHKEWLQGGVIYHVRKGGKFKEVENGKYAGKGGFKSYCEEVLDLSYRKAMDLATIYSQFQKHGVGRDKMTEIGWSKAAKIAAVMDDENAEELVDHAEKLPIRDLNETIKESYSKKGRDTREVVRKVAFRFMLQQDAGATVRDIFEQAKEVLNETSDEAVFEHIVMQWAGDHLNVEKKSTTGAGKGRASGRGKAA